VCRCPWRRTEVAFLPLARMFLPDVVPLIYCMLSLL
jgi:hypothetical protein